MALLSSETASTEFRNKPSTVQELINEALAILVAFGIPLGGLTSRRLEQMALAFLAVADVRQPGTWAKAKDYTSRYSVKTREIISYINTHFGENISPGSYDDVRRRYLALPVLAGIIIQTKPAAARNDSTRGYGLAPDFAQLIRRFGTPSWDAEVADFMATRIPLEQQLTASRTLVTHSVTLPSGAALTLDPGEHNELQRAIITQFLPRYGYAAEVLYIGDASNKMLHIHRERLQTIRFPFAELEHGELPDILAYSATKNWLYLIEAVHSSGAMSATRLLKLRQLTAGCTAARVYVTAFLNRSTFRRFVADIAWETEVWIAAEPDHLIHFNGEKFLGPYIAKEVSE